MSEQQMTNEHEHEHSVLKGGEVRLLREAIAERDRHIAELEGALKDVRVGYGNILEFRKMVNGRYGNLTREELDDAIAGIDAALAGKGVSRG